MKNTKQLSTIDNRRALPTLRFQNFKFGEISRVWGFVFY